MSILPEQVTKTHTHFTSHTRFTSVKLQKRQNTFTSDTRFTSET